MPACVNVRQAGCGVFACLSPAARGPGQSRAPIRAPGHDRSVRLLAWLIDEWRGSMTLRESCFALCCALICLAGGAVDGFPEFRTLVELVHQITDRPVK